MTRIVPVRRIYERGFALVAAIFIVVVLAMIGIFMVTISGVERSTATAAVQGARAYYAARSGIEWGTFEALNNIGATCATPPLPPITNTLSLAVPGLNGFTVQVTCSYTPHREHGPPDYFVFVITSTAASGAFGAPDYVMRTLQATVTNAPAP